MKKPITLIVLILMIVFAFSFASFLETLELTKTNAQDAVWNSFTYGSYSGPASKTYHNFAVPLRVSMVKEIGAFAKAYTQTEHFKSRYAAYRLGQQPTPPEPLVTTSEQKKKMRGELQKSLNEAETALKGYTGDIRKGAEEGVKMLKDMLKSLDDPNNPMFSAETDAMLKKGHDDQVRGYENSMKEWELEFPVSPQGMIKERLFSAAFLHC